MNRTLQLALALLCLLAVAVAPVLCLHASSAPTTAAADCARTMQHSMPGMPHPTNHPPSCCVAHPHSQPAIATDAPDAPTLAITSFDLPSSPLPTASLHLPLSGLTDTSPPRPRLTALRI